MTTYTVTLDKDDNNEFMLPLPEAALAELGWKPGDTLNWQENDDGTFTLTKTPVKTTWVMVECVRSFRTCYMVEVPQGKEPWALDTVSMNEAKKFSHDFLGEHIISHRVVPKQEALLMCRDTGGLGDSWQDSEIEEHYFTKYKA